MTQGTAAAAKAGLPVICLMGPTATGKTDIAVRLRERIAADIISVDSALVYRGMDIGTAKPDAETLALAPHRLIDIRDPVERYSAGDFVADARREIDAIHQGGRVPLLVGGTMMYFRSLIEGIADLPPADAAIRQRLNSEAEEQGWPRLHSRLAEIDPAAASRINENDSQRIQRALEVYELSGRAMSAWHAEPAGDGLPHRFIRLALIPADRGQLHKRIEARFDLMMQQGFVEEVSHLMRLPGLAADSPAMRAVGYRQIRAYLDGQCDLQTACHKARIATRQLAKRQMTWLRSEKQLKVFDPLESDPFDAIMAFVVKQMDERRIIGDN